MIGALIFALPYLYTMETWWLGWRLPGHYLVVFAIVGLAVVGFLAKAAGFRRAEQKHETSRLQAAVDMLELSLQSFLAAYLVLIIFGILEFGHPWLVVARLGLIEVVPLALGAAIANHALSGGQEGSTDAPFPKDIAIVAVGALFLSLPIAPTEEMTRMAAHAAWHRLPAIIGVSLVTIYLVLFELEFQGQPARAKGLTPKLQAGAVFLVYMTAFVVAFALLAVFGQFRGAPFGVWMQKTVVLSFLASVGGSAARVIF